MMKIKSEKIASRFPFFIFQFPILIVSLLSCLPLQAQQDPPAGFTALFNGRDLSGWYGWTTRDPKELWAMSAEEQANYKKQSIAGGLLDKKGQPINEHLNAHWKVENHDLVNDGHGHYLTTDKDYGDFELHLEYKALPKGDSGVICVEFHKSKSGTQPRKILKALAEQKARVDFGTTKARRAKTLRRKWTNRLASGIPSR